MDGTARAVETRLRFICNSRRHNQYDISGWQSQWRHRLWRRVASRFLGNATSTCYKCQNVRSSFLKNVYCWWITTDSRHANNVQRCKETSRRFLVKTPIGFVGDTCIFFKCDELSWSRAFTFNALLIFLEYLFVFLINTAPPVSDNVYEQNFTAKKL